jgi:hypothetical protein
MRLGGEESGGEMPREACGRGEVEGEERRLIGGGIGCRLMGMEKGGEVG